MINLESVVNTNNNLALNAETPAILLEKNRFTQLIDIPTEPINKIPEEDRIVINSEEILGIYQDALEDMEETRHIFGKYSFDWDLIDVVIGGKSSVDL
ncbi:MAG: hypothetical protein H7263_05545, partial [Candidatus Sericytochromatia bacterium]|nr:hypothetical protein [Candidatus Sericytochromatia bacterium]